MLLSALFFKARYTSGHCLGTAICISGLACVVLSDLLPRSSTPASGSGDEGASGTGTGAGGADDDATTSSHAAMYTRTKVLGDFFALGGAFMYATSNVLQEALTKYDISSISRTIAACARCVGLDVQLTSSDTHSSGNGNGSKIKRGGPHLPASLSTHAHTSSSSSSSSSPSAAATAAAVKKKRREEYIGYIGLFGTMLALVQG